MPPGRSTRRISTSARAGSRKCISTPCAKAASNEWAGTGSRYASATSKRTLSTPSLDGQRTRLLDLCGLEIDADYLAGSHHLGHTQRDGPWAAAYIQHLHAAM